MLAILSAAVLKSSPGMPPIAGALPDLTLHIELFTSPMLILASRFSSSITFPEVYSSAVVPTFLWKTFWKCSFQAPIYITGWVGILRVTGLTVAPNSFELLGLDNS